MLLYSLFDVSLWKRITMAWLIDMFLCHMTSQSGARLAPVITFLTFQQMILSVNTLCVILHAASIVCLEFTVITSEQLFLAMEHSHVNLHVASHGSLIFTILTLKQ